MACKLGKTPQGFLTLRLHYAGQRWREGTKLRDTPKNKERLQARCVLISEAMKSFSFKDWYLKWFPDGKRARELTPRATSEKAVQTVGEFYRNWIERKKPPFVRPGLHYDYERQFRKYILPKFEEAQLSEITLPVLEAFRSYLNIEAGLSLKSCRNIIDGTFRAMMRDARRYGLIEKDVFVDLEWPRIPTPKPDPFTEDERNKITGFFRERHPFYHAFLVTMFGTGARPSEIIALRWGDVDLRAGTLSICKSHYMGVDNATKTAASERVISLAPHIVTVLKNHKPLHIGEDDFVFTNQEKRPIHEDKWRKKYWRRALRACEIRPRKFYATRHTFISVALSHGNNIKWVAEYCGTSVAMIEKHYGRYIKSDAKEQLAKMFKEEPVTEPVTPINIDPGKMVQVAGKITGRKWSGRVDLNHRLHGPEPCALPS